MQDPASSTASPSAGLRAALLDYCRSPGKYQVGSRQPPVLFLALREVLQIAVDRDGDAIGNVEASSLRDAARFFVRTALLFPGADHYAILGMERTAENADLKDRYRLMMRLLHPDFSGPSAGSWPADSAVRVNRAYDTLSSSVQRRSYDESLAQSHGSKTVSSAELMRQRPTAGRPDDGDARQSRFKTLAAVCALAGAGLVALILSATGSPEAVQLVQRARVQPEAQSVTMEEASSPPDASPLAKLQDALAQLRPAPAAPPPRPVERPTARAALAIPMQKRAEPPSAPAIESAGRSPAPAPEPRPEIILAAAPAVGAAPAPAPTPAPAVVAVAAPIQATPTASAASRAGPTLQEAQPLLSQLLQVMESGRGERILNLLDAEARSKPSAQALSRQYDSIVDGARPVRVSHVELKAEPGDGRLLVVGYFRVLAGEQAIGALGKKMMLRAEFTSREGNVVITALSGGPVN